VHRADILPEGHADLTEENDTFTHRISHADLASGEWPRVLMFSVLLASGRHPPRVAMLTWLRRMIHSLTVLALTWLVMNGQGQS
jgi:hypothetical protein